MHGAISTRTYTPRPTVCSDREWRAIFPPLHDAYRNGQGQGKEWGHVFKNVYCSRERRQGQMLTKTRSQLYPPGVRVVNILGGLSHSVPSSLKIVLKYASGGDKPTVLVASTSYKCRSQWLGNVRIGNYPLGVMGCRTSFQ